MTDAGRLEGWEAIAAHLRVNKRTAQLWRKHRGLPVESTPTGRVSADPLRLDQWLQNEPPQPPEQRHEETGWRWWVLAAAVLLAGVGFVMRARSSPVASVESGPEHVAALDEQGRQLWRKAFSPSFHAAIESIPRRSFVVDVDGDGREEVFVVYIPVDVASSGSHLICYSSEGTERWRFRAGASSRVGKGTSPTFMIRSVHVVPCKSGQCLVLVSAHFPYSASQIALLDSHGSLVSEYWHSGHLDYAAVTDLDNDGRPEIVAGGVNNGSGRATLVVLDVDRLDGAAVETEEERRFEGMAPAHERARILFPRSRLNERTHQYNWVNSVSVTRGEVQVQVNEHESSSYCSIWYKFDCGMKVTSVVVADQFAVVRKRLILTGILKPTLDDEDVRRFNTVEYLAGQPVPDHPAAATCNTSK